MYAVFTDNFKQNLDLFQNLITLTDTLVILLYNYNAMHVHVCYNCSEFYSKVRFCLNALYFSANFMLKLRVATLTENECRKDTHIVSVRLIHKEPPLYNTSRCIDSRLQLA